MKSHRTTGSLRFEQLEQRRMLSSTLDAVLEEDYTPVHAANEVAASAPGLAAPVSADHQVPFKGSLQGDVTTTGQPPIVTVNISATGNASHLGHFSLMIPHTVDRTTRTAVGTYQFVAANGDTLTASFTGQAAPTATPGVLAIVENATITGGTGRFTNASGSFVCERLFDTIHNTTAGSFTGMVSSPGAAKH